MLLVVTDLLVVFQDKEKPRYVGAFVAHIVVYSVQCAALLAMRALLMRRNAIRRRQQPTEGQESHRHAFDDLTDKENPDCKSSYLLRDLRLHLTYLTVRYTY